MAIKLYHSDDDFSANHEINVTPFIDVMLVLLIIFMVAAPLATVDVNVDLPASKALAQPRHQTKSHPARSRQSPNRAAITRAANRNTAAARTTAETTPAGQAGRTSPGTQAHPGQNPADAPPQIQAPPAPNAAAPGASSALSSTDVPKWQALLLAPLEQFKQYPYEAQINHEEGVVYLRFTMDRQGKVLPADIATSSGFDALDQETLALIRRAEPLPPPPEVSGDFVELTVPVQFFLK
jgi:TonB family protein